ncbi:hypothetical protein [Paraburkholderia fungorum]|uniref:Uncharacterized protein n=1 Tax=Paraburkholderia fungorum TaxID=134537 RepID=A0AAW3UUS0_9BURK|nr:hypothetical protein [Paraburkholderia fungorum]MBB4513288.1 hypothetical protein [Paraburkholderia fungorum]MBB6201285.1 hypothetical protein [Paraburkholderia fungorum]USU21320.1 hypothetical protein NFE55_29975 [Paraburkholderia fungorum]USU26684.1 hypothetical protein NFS19_31590 [Paraburkholderia fungorum]
MSKSTKKQPASRPPVDALQYEKLALSAFDLCNRHLDQLNTLITLASSICRNPPITLEERRRRQTLLELLVDTSERYQQELQCDRELYQVIALDAKGVPQSRITARHAATLLAEEVMQRGGESLAAENAPLGENGSAEDAAALSAEGAAEQAVVAVS